MEPIFIPPESHSPRVEFYPSGSLLLEGRSMPENVFKMFNPLIDFAKNLIAPKVDFDINLEYFNTATSKQILGILQALDENKNIGELIVIWHYEEDDDDSVEMAEIFEECLSSRTEFYYLVHEKHESLSRTHEKFNIPR